MLGIDPVGEIEVPNDRLLIQAIFVGFFVCFLLLEGGGGLGEGEMT